MKNEEGKYPFGYSNNEQKRETDAGQNTDLPYRWFMRIGKLPTNNEEVNDPDFHPETREEIFCPLNDMDMLALQQQDVMEELLEYCFFSEELNSIRKRVVEETWGNQAHKPKGFGDN